MNKNPKVGQEKIGGDAQPQVSLLMIMKNEGERLARCFQSVQDVVDEIIAVDTGSTDNTVDIAESFGARVFHQPWNDDFSAPRNFGLTKATGKWILMLDADEELHAEDIRALKDALKEDASEAYNLTIVDSADPSNSFLSVRLWRRNPDTLYEGRVHERLNLKPGPDAPSIQSLGARIMHHGATQRSATDKSQRDLKLLEKEADERPKDFRLAFLLGQEYEKSNRLEEAVSNYRLALNESPEVYTPAVARNLGRCLIELKRYPEAATVLRKARQRFPGYTDLSYLLGIVNLKEHRYDDAESELRKCLRLGDIPPRHFGWPGAGSYLAWQNIGVCHAAQNQFDAAAEAFMGALRINRRDSNSLEYLAKILKTKMSPEQIRSNLEPLADLADRNIKRVLDEIAGKDAAAEE